MAAEESPNGKPLLVVGGSNSGTVTIFEINFGGKFRLRDFNTYQCVMALLKQTCAYEPRHEITNNVVCVTIKASDQPAHLHSLIRAFASRLNIV